MTKGLSVVFMLFGFPGKSQCTILYCTAATPDWSNWVMTASRNPEILREGVERGSGFGDELHVAAQRALVPGLLNQGNSYMAATSI